VRSALFSPGGNFIVSAGDDNTVRLWEVPGGKEFKRYKTRSRWNTRAVFSPDGRFLAASGYDNSVEVWEANQNQDCRTFSKKRWIEANYAIHADSNRIVGLSLLDLRFDVRDLLTGKQLTRLEGYSGPPVELLTGVFTIAPLISFSPDAKQIACAISDGDVGLWDSTSGANVRTFQGIAPAAPAAIAYSSDGARLAAAGGNKVCFWDVASGRLIAKWERELSEVNSLAFSPDGRRLVTGSGTRALLLWDVETGQIVRTLWKGGGYGNWPSQVLFSSDGRLIAAITSGDLIEVFDADSGQLRFNRSGHTAKVFQIAISANGRRLASAGDDGTVRVWSLSTGQELLQLEASLRKPSTAGPPGLLAFSSDGRRLTAIAKNGAAFIWDGSPPAQEEDP
jgi:WD40 repeat protein